MIARMVRARCRQLAGQLRAGIARNACVKLSACDGSRGMASRNRMYCATATQRADAFDWKLPPPGCVSYDELKHSAPLQLKGIRPNKPTAWTSRTRDERGLLLDRRAPSASDQEWLEQVCRYIQPASNAHHLTQALTLLSNYSARSPKGRAEVRALLVDAGLLQRWWELMDVHLIHESSGFVLSKVMHSLALLDEPPSRARLDAWLAAAGDFSMFKAHELSSALYSIARLGLDIIEQPVLDAWAARLMQLARADEIKFSSHFRLQVVCNSLFAIEKLVSSSHNKLSPPKDVINLATHALRFHVAGLKRAELSGLLLSLSKLNILLSEDTWASVDRPLARFIQHMEPIELVSIYSALSLQSSYHFPKATELRLQARVEETLHRFDTNALTIYLHSLATLQFDFPLGVWKAWAARFLELHKELSALELSLLMWALARLNFPALFGAPDRAGDAPLEAGASARALDVNSLSGKVYATWKEAFELFLRDTSRPVGAVVLANAIYGVARSGLGDLPASDALFEAWCGAFRREMTSFGPQEFGSTNWALGNMNRQYSPEFVVQWIDRFKEVCIKSSLHEQMNFLRALARMHATSCNTFDSRVSKKALNEIIALWQEAVSVQLDRCSLLDLSQAIQFLGQLRKDASESPSEDESADTAHIEAVAASALENKGLAELSPDEVYTHSANFDAANAAADDAVDSIEDREAPHAKLKPKKRSVPNKSDTPFFTKWQRALEQRLTDQEDCTFEQLVNILVAMPRLKRKLSPQCFEAWCAAFCATSRGQTSPALLERMMLSIVRMGLTPNDSTMMHWKLLCLENISLFPESTIRSCIAQSRLAHSSRSDVFTRMMHLRLN